MIRTIDLQSVANQTPNVEKVAHSHSQGNDQQSHKFSMQLEQERQAAQKRVGDSEDSHAPRKREGKEKDEKGKQADSHEKKDGKSPKREAVVESLLNIRLLDITV